MISWLLDYLLYGYWCVCILLLINLFDFEFCMVYYAFILHVLKMVFETFQVHEMTLE